MYACDYLENGVLDALRAVTFAAPANCYLALYLNNPGENGLGGTEVSYTGYRRMKIDFSVPSVPADSDSGLGIQNIADIAFPTPISAAGTITHIGVLDSLAGGNMLARGELVEPLVIGANEPPVFLAGDVLFYLTGNLSKAWKTKVLNVFRGTSIQGVTPYFFLWNGLPETVELKQGYMPTMVTGAAVPVDFHDRFSETAEILTARIWAAKNTPATMELAEKLTTQIAGSKNIQATLTVSEVLTSMTKATSQTTERTTVQLTIPPGAELRIDSEFFLVLLDGENVLHTQSGDWIKVSRDLLRIIVESASGGNLRGQLIYTERYL